MVVWIAGGAGASAAVDRTTGAALDDDGPPLAVVDAGRSAGGASTWLTAAMRTVGARQSPTAAPARIRNTFGAGSSRAHQLWRGGGPYDGGGGGPNCFTVDTLSRANVHYIR